MYFTKLPFTVKVGLCTAPAPAPVPLTRLVPARVEEKPTCVLCEYVMHQLQDFIKQGQTEAEIKQELQAVCNELQHNRVY